MLNINPKLEKYIFDELGAVYQIDPENVSCNLANNREANLNYLGTYFPRSFVESYNIYTNLFSNGCIKRAFLERETINILDIGSGTGGNLIGLLQVLNDTYRDKNIGIYSIDGNDIALEYQRRFIRDLYKFMEYNGNYVKIRTLCHKFTGKTDIKNTIDKKREKKAFYKFDIIHTFKFVNELYTADFQLNQGTYKEVLNIGENYLSENGILIIEDITNRIGAQYMSIIMNNECREYFNQTANSRIHIILPLSCAFWHENCISRNCFTKKEFSIKHRYNSNDISKVTYKVLTTTELARKVLSHMDNCDCYYHVISEDNRNNHYNYCLRGSFFYGEGYLDEDGVIKINSFVL